MGNKELNLEYSEECDDIKNKRIKKLANRLREKTWHSVIMRTCTQATALKDIIDSAKFITKVEGPYGNRSWTADPFIIKGGNNLIVEAINPDTQKGEIWSKSLETRLWTRLIAKSDKHYSFPRLVEYRNKSYLTCETPDSKGLEIYEAKNNGEPIRRLQLTGYLEKEIIIDPVLEAVGTELILECTTKSKGCKILHKGRVDIKEFSIEKVPSSIRSKNNIRTMRNAGNTIYTKGIEITPKQEWNETYGSGIWFSDKKTGEYIASLQMKDEKCSGPHTFNYDKGSGMIAIDYCILSFSMHDVVRKLWKMVKI